MTDLTIALDEFYRSGLSASDWRQLLTGLVVGDDYDPDMRVSLGDVAAINGAADALWCVRLLDWSDVAVRRAVISGVLLPAVKRAAAHTSDRRVHDCVGAVERWCAGDDTVDLIAAAEAAEAAAAAARGAAWAAAAAARAAEWAAADAARAAAADDTWDAEREQQRRDIIAAFPPLVVKEV